MRKTDVEIVQGVFEAWNTGDLDAVTAFFAEDVKWVEIGGRLDRPETMGRETLRAGFASLFETWEYYRLEPEEIRDLGGRVLAVVREVARGRSSGLEVDGRWGYVMRVRAGRISHVEAYRDPRQAIEAVGLAS